MKDMKYHSFQARRGQEELNKKNFGVALSFARILSIFIKR